jgi:hypothetical protein
MVVVSGFDPDQEQPSTAKVFISHSRVQRPQPKFGTGYIFTTLWVGDICFHYTPRFNV